MKLSEQTQLDVKVMAEKVGLDWNEWSLGRSYFLKADNDGLTLCICFVNTKTQEIKLFSAVGLGLIEPNE